MQECLKGGYYVNDNSNSFYDLSGVLSKPIKEKCKEAMQLCDPEPCSIAKCNDPPDAICE